MATQQKCKGDERTRRKRGAKWGHRGPKRMDRKARRELDRITAQGAWGKPSSAPKGAGR